MVRDSPVDSIFGEFSKHLNIPKVAIYGLSILSAGMFLFLPFFNLLHPILWHRWMGTIHSFAALRARVVAVYTGHLVFPLLSRVSKILPQMRTLTFSSTAVAFLGIATGNLAYMHYVADFHLSGGVRAWLKENSPLAHYLFIKFYAFSILFTLPLQVACTWIFWKYGDSILEKENGPVLTASCMTLMAMIFFAKENFFANHVKSLTLNGNLKQRLVK
jgi:hypothetical protein